MRFLVWLAPLGILGLVADRIGQAGGGAVVWQELAVGAAIVDRVVPADETAVPAAP